MTWTTVGHISVDAGLCWVGDPCYVLHTAPTGIGSNWDEFCGKLDELDKTGAQQFKFNHEHPGLGVVVSTGYGDGEYPVEIRKTSDGRVAEVRVVFVRNENE